MENNLEEINEEKEEMKRQFLLRQILTSKARQRLSNLRLIKSDFVRSLELHLINLAQENKIEIPITDEYLKEFLRTVSRKREIKIRRSW